jgi:hypothetical protein
VGKICWIPLKGNNFEVKSYYQVMVSPTPDFGPLKSIWKSKAPPRVAFFVWTAVLEKILTLNNLRKNIIVIEWCCMCNEDNQLIIYYWIVRLLLRYGAWFFSCLVLHW